MRFNNIEEFERFFEENVSQNLKEVDSKEVFKILKIMVASTFQVASCGEAKFDT